MSSSFRIEKLEDRILLAGNITAIQNGSQLVINGDADDNAIIVEGTGAGSVDVYENDGGTVNGVAMESFSGITHIVIRGRAGDDVAFAGDLDIEGNLTIQLNNGDGDVQVGVVEDSYIGGNLAVSSSGDTDTVIQLVESAVAGGAKLVSGNGEDEIVVVDAGVGGDLVINANHGDSFVFFGGFASGVGVGGRLVVLEGADDLLLDGENVTVGSTLNIDAGARGDSEILLHDFDVGGQMWVRTGDGFDRVHICDVEVDLGTVIALRESDDLLEVGDSTFHSHFQASGGPHDAGDEFVDNGGNTFDVDPIVTRFETFSFGEGCGIEM